VIVNSPNKTPKKLVKKAALAMADCTTLREKKSRFEGIFLLLFLHVLSAEFFFTSMASTSSLPAVVDDYGDDNDKDGVFQVYLIDEPETHENEYLQRLSDDSFLSILQRARVKNAFHSEHKEKALFQLFLAPSLWDSILQWTNVALKGKGKCVISIEKLMAFVGLEIGMSLVQIVSIASYWSTKPFSGHPDFRNTMSRTDFQTIRGSLQFHPPGYDVDVATRDPLYHCRCFLNNFQKNCASVAVPLGSSALDEASCRTSGRTRAKTYMPNKPMKYGIRFYAVVGSRHVYCHSLWDNGSGNTLSTTQGDRYTEVFRDLRTPFDKAYSDDPEGKYGGVKKNSASALWSLQIAHQTKKQRDPSGKRTFLMDNFYTRHNLGEKLKLLTDDEVRITGTCRLNVIQANNKVGVKKGIDMLKNKERGTWVLVQAFNLQRADNDVMAAPNCGYIIFKDRRDVIFYTNDLADTPNELAVIGNNNEHAISCVNGLSKLHRWTDDCMLHRQAFMAPAPIVAYNLFMNAVDRMDQRRQPRACQRWEKRVSMSVFSMVMDLACSNGYAVGCTLSSEYKAEVTFSEFKRRVAEQLTSPWIAGRPKTKEGGGRKRKRNDQDSIDCLSTHILSENERRQNGVHLKCGDCFLCVIMGIEQTGSKARGSKYGCFQCGQCYHIECFNRMHHRHLNSSDFNTALNLAINGKTRTRRRDIVTDPKSRPV
jgi:hypothetical protein